MRRLHILYLEVRLWLIRCRLKAQCWLCQPIDITGQAAIALLAWAFYASVVVLLLTSCGVLDYSMIPAEPAHVTGAELHAATATKEPDTRVSFSPSPAPLACTVTTGVPAGYLNLRAGAGTEYAVVRVLTEGEELLVLRRGPWLEVTDGHGVRGFINSKYCTGD